MMIVIWKGNNMLWNKYMFRYKYVGIQIDFEFISLTIRINERWFVFQTYVP